MGKKVWAPLQDVLSVKPEVVQVMALRAWSTARNSAFIFSFSLIFLIFFFLLLLLILFRHACKGTSVITFIRLLQVVWSLVFASIFTRDLFHCLSLWYALRGWLGVKLSRIKESLSRVNFSLIWHQHLPTTSGYGDGRMLVLVNESRKRGSKGSAPCPRRGIYLP